MRRCPVRHWSTPPEGEIGGGVGGVDVCLYVKVIDSIGLLLHLVHTATFLSLAVWLAVLRPGGVN